MIICILVRTCFSDHALVILSLQREKCVGNANVHIPERILLDDAYKLDIEHIWYQALAIRVSSRM